MSKTENFEPLAEEKYVRRCGSEAVRNFIIHNSLAEVEKKGRVGWNLENKRVEGERKGRERECKEQERERECKEQERERKYMPNVMLMG